MYDAAARSRRTEDFRNLMASVAGLAPADAAARLRSDALLLEDTDPALAGALVNEAERLESQA